MLGAEVVSTLEGWLLSGNGRPFPHQRSHVYHGPEPAPLPAEDTPAFAGFYDWHSAVHSHLAMLQLCKMGHKATEDILRRNLSPRNLDAELAHLQANQRFEMPYGIAWLYRLCAEAKGTDYEARLAPFAELAGDRLLSWFQSLPAAIRSGEHTQSAFAMSMAWESAALLGRDNLRSHIEERAIELHTGDHNAPIHLEPSAYDFLSPSLSVAELMGRCLAGPEFGQWLGRWLPDPGAMKPVAVGDPEDGKRAHWNGLNLSRAWMLGHIAAALPTDDSRVGPLRHSASKHQATAMATLEARNFASTHWLSSFVLRAVLSSSGDSAPAQS